MNEKDKSKNPAPGDQNNPENKGGAAGDPAAGGGDKSQTVPLKAMQEERARRQKAEAELARLKGEKTSDENGEQQKPIRLKSQDLMDLSAEELENYLNQTVNTAVAAAVSATEKKFRSFQSKSETDKVIAKYAIFADEDKRLARAALADLAEKMEQNPEKSLDELARETAQEWSKYKVARAAQDNKGKTGDEENHETLPPAGGGSELSHLKQKREPVKSFDEASAEADKRAQAFDAEQRAKGG